MTMQYSYSFSKLILNTKLKMSKQFEKDKLFIVYLTPYC